MLQFEKINKRFGKLQVLKDLDLEISQGGIIAILGPNGSGKTTLIKCALGIVLPDAGNITLNGQGVVNKWHYRNDINYLPQIATFPNNLTVSELIEMVKSLREKPSSESPLIEMFALEPFLSKKLSTLSGGTKQKVNIALSFIFDSPLLILDEPTAGLDPVALLQFKKLLAQEKAAGKTILLTTHIMSLVEGIADEIVFLLEGKIYFKGTLQELKEKTKQETIESAIATILMNQ